MLERRMAIVSAAYFTRQGAGDGRYLQNRQNVDE